MALGNTFKAKIIALIALAMAGMLLLAALSFWQVRTLMLDGRKAQLTVAVQSARSLVDGYRKKAADGAMSVAEAQSAAKEALRAARYGDDGSDYFYIWTLDGVSVMLPSKPEWAGQNMIGKVKDASGADVIQSMTSAAKASETGWAFVLTQFPHPGGTVPAPKLQLVTVVREWNWMLGSGLYMDEAEAQVRATLFKMAGFALAMILALGAVGTWVARVVLRQVGGEPAHAVAVMRRVAQGDLRTEPVAAPEGSLLFELQRTVVSLRSTVYGVRDSIDGITTASAEIAAGGRDLSRRTEQAAANLQQTAAAMEQLTGTVSATARSACEAGQQVDQACVTAAESRRTVDRVVATMGSIQVSSQRIAEITGVIDGIAFQTNILALNAAVEAARAGDQGRGFAVVAGEVRTLAQRSAQAAREIKSLIQESVERVGDGGRQVQAAGISIQSLVDRVSHVQGTVNRITAAAAEQASGIGEVCKAVAELDGVTQQNSALVEQSGAAAESLREQADALRHTMAMFHL